jgi:predicted flap endonuclease-1-like 5' DNA nuclease
LWPKSDSNIISNREAEAAKKAEQARKKAEKDAILAEEEKDARVAPKNAKQAVKKTKGLDLSQLDDEGPKSATALNATGIDNALDALSLTTNDAAKVDKHPERRFKAAFAAYEERRLKEMDEDGSGQGLRQNQKREKIRKEFEKHEDNPFNQVSARYDASKDEIKELREQEKRKIEARLGEKWGAEDGYDNYDELASARAEPWVTALKLHETQENDWYVVRVELEKARTETTSIRNGENANFVIEFIYMIVLFQARTIQPPIDFETRVLRPLSSFVNIMQYSSPNIYNYTQQWCHNDYPICPLCGNSIYL